MVGWKPRPRTPAPASGAGQFRALPHRPAIQWRRHQEAARQGQRAHPAGSALCGAAANKVVSGCIADAAGGSAGEL